MDIELREYTLAFNAHLKAQQDEMASKLTVRATYYRLMQARDALKDREKELLKEVERNH